MIETNVLRINISEKNKFYAQLPNDLTELSTVNYKRMNCVLTAFLLRIAGITGEQVANKKRACITDEERSSSSNVCVDRMRSSTDHLYAIVWNVYMTYD